MVVSGPMSKATRTTRHQLQPESPRRLIRPRTKWARRFDRWIRQAAEENGYTTIGEVADALGYSRDWILAIRRGDKAPGPVARRELERYMAGQLTPNGSGS